MCLAIPGKIESVQDDELRKGLVSFAGITKEVCLAMVPEAGIGDYVIVHVGFAISKVDEAAAQETLAMLKELSEDSQQNPEPS
jgi:hydrogenase expression/formation protein HypC